MRKSKMKEAIKKALKVYYQQGLTNTASRFRKEIHKEISKRLKR